MSHAVQLFFNLLAAKLLFQCHRILRISLCISVFGWLLVYPTVIHAHNGAVTYVFPLEGISLDGDLNDWPSGMTLHSIEMLEVGVPADNDQDLKAHFRIGFDKSQNTIYIAVEVMDQSIMIDTAGYVNWNTRDGMELYLDPNHMRSVSEMTQYSLYATNRLIFGYKKSWDGVKVASKITETGRTYEWSITPEFDLQAGNTLSFDLAVTDMDQDKSFSWVAWGKHSQKLSSADNSGELMVVRPGTEIIAIEGQLDYTQLISKPVSVPLRFTNVLNPKRYFQIFTDSLGAFSLSIPAGDYLMEVPEQLMQVENKFYRLAPTEPVKIVVNSEYPELAMLAPKQIPAPNLSPTEGILHSFDQSQQQLLDRFIETYQEYYAIPGVSLALIKNGEIAYYRTYGVKDTKTKQPVTEETLFEAASITKPVFGYVVLSLAEKGIIDLDKPLYEYLAFEALEETPEYKKMTARHVLVHTSGLPNWGVPLEHTPGTQYGYSGEGFEYLKRVVCKITSKNIEQLLDEEVIGPLGLYHMEFKDSEELRKVAAIGHQGSHPTYWPIPSEPGMAHSMHTEAKAFSRFAIALLKQQGLSPATYQELEKIHTESPSEYWNSPNYREGAGLGVHVRESGQGMVIGHGGNNGDFKCLFEVYQDLDMGYVVFTNSSLGDQLAGDLAEFLIEGSAAN